MGDRESWFEIKPAWARERGVGLPGSRGVRRGGGPTSRWQKGGILDVDAAKKAARFLACATRSKVPLVYLVDVPGLPGRLLRREAGGYRNGQDDVADSEATGAEDHGRHAQGLRPPATS